MKTVCCSYDTDVFEVKQPQIVKWDAIGKSVKRMGIDEFIRVGVKSSIEDWILNDMHGICNFLRLKQVPSSLKGMIVLRRRSVKGERSKCIKRLNTITNRDYDIQTKVACPSKVIIPKGYRIEWMGNYDYKGLGIIWKSEMKAEVPKWYNPKHQYFLPIIKTFLLTNNTIATIL